MNAALRLFLIVMLALTSQGLASARGTPRAVSELVICAGATITSISVDENGKPVRRTDFCPDMAAQLLAALSTAPVLPVPVLTLARPSDPIVPEARRGGEAPTAQARDPPRRLA